MKNNIGCLIYCVICLVLSVIIYIFQKEGTFLDAFFASVGLMLGTIVLISIVAFPIMKIIESVREQGWNIKNNETFQVIVYGLWVFLVIYMYCHNNCVKYVKMYDYHDIIYWFFEISCLAFLIFLPSIVEIFIEYRNLKESQKDYDLLKNRCSEFEQLLLEHKIIKYGEENE